MLSSPSVSVTGINELSNHSLNGNSIRDNSNDIANTNVTPTTSNLCNGTRIIDQKVLADVENENQPLLKNASDYNGGSLLCNGIINETKNSVDSLSVNNINKANNVNSFSEHINDVKHIDASNGNGTLIENEKKEVDTNKNDTQALKANNNILTEEKHELNNSEYTQQLKINGNKVKLSSEESSFDRLIMPAGVDASMPISKFLENDLEAKNHLNGLFSSKAVNFEQKLHCYIYQFILLN